MNFNVHDRVIFLAKHGSHAYGLATPTSDIDIKGIAIEPKEYFYGFLHTFEQHEAMAHNGHPEDKVIYSLKKFMKLAADCNPNIIEVLHVDDADILEMDATGQALREIKDKFLSKKARFTFAGYAHTQLRRIKTHREWLLNPPKAAPERKDYGLDSKREVSKSDLGAFQAYEQLTQQGKDAEGLISELPSNVVELLQKEKAYANAKLHWEQFLNWKKTRNPARAELEAKYGYDTKHGSHLLRLMRMCKEILEGKGVIVKRPDREELLSVKMGGYPYDALIEEAERLERECDELYKTSTLPHKPDMNFLHDFCVEAVEGYLKLYG